MQAHLRRPSHMRPQMLPRRRQKRQNQAAERSTFIVVFKRCKQQQQQQQQRRRWSCCCCCCHWRKGIFHVYDCSQFQFYHKEKGQEGARLVDKETVGDSTAPAADEIQRHRRPSQRPLQKQKCFVFVHGRIRCRTCCSLFTTNIVVVVVRLRHGGIVQVPGTWCWRCWWRWI